MDLIDVDRNKLVLEIDAQEWGLISGLFEMISRNSNPSWEDSGSPDDHMTPEQFDDLYDKWSSLTDGEKARAFFVGKDE